MIFGTHRTKEEFDFEFPIPEISSFDPELNFAYFKNLRKNEFLA